MCIGSKLIAIRIVTLVGCKLQLHSSMIYLQHAV